MIRYHNFDVVFAEIPGEVTLAINLTGCPNRCPGCHSPHLRAHAGRLLDDTELRELLLRYGGSVTCLCFMGGDAEPQEVARLAVFARQVSGHLRVGWYSGRERMPEEVAPRTFDYLKLGGWVEALGPLSSPATNQRLYRVGTEGSLTDLTERFRRKA